MMSKVRHISLIACIIAVALFTGCNNVIFVNSGECTKKDYTSLNSVNLIQVNTYRTEVEFSVSTDESVHIVYYENAKYKYDVGETEDGALVVSQHEINVVSIFELPNEAYKLSIAVPAQFLGDIEIDSNRTDVTFNDVHAGSITIRGDRAEIVLAEVLISENLKIDGYRTAISIADSKVGNDVSLETQRDNIILRDLEFGSELTVINYRGDIEGTVQGAIADYSIISVVHRGETNLPNDMPGGDKQIYAEVSRGDISIDFISD